MDWQKNDDDRVEGSARQGVELGVEETETGRKVVEGEGERGRESYTPGCWDSKGWVPPSLACRTQIRPPCGHLAWRPGSSPAESGSQRGRRCSCALESSVRPGRSVSFSKKILFPNTHTHTHTNTTRSHSFFLSLTAGSSTSISSLSHTRVHPVPACRGEGVREGIRFPNSFSHFTFFFLEGITIAKLEELEEEHLLKGLDDSRGRHDAHVGPAWAGGGKTAQDGNGT